MVSLKFSPWICLPHHFGLPVHTYIYWLYHAPFLPDSDNDTITGTHGTPLGTTMMATDASTGKYSSIGITQT